MSTELDPFETPRIAPMGDTVQHSWITFKYGGTWGNIKNQSRRKYRGGQQKTVKLEQAKINFFMLKSEVEKICPWFRGLNFDLHYHICGSSPKEYNCIIRDFEVTEMINQATETSRFEVVISNPDENYTAITSQGGLDSANLGMRMSQAATYDDIIATDSYNENHIKNTLCIGSRFSDANHFKQVIRTQAIVQNFGMVIRASDKKRVIDVCSSEGCPWRVRASVCADGETFEVKKLNGLHSCPGVNRCGNRQASADWVAQEIQDIVKKHPEIPPKQINSSLERTYGLSLPYMKLWRSREQAREFVFGSVEDNYRWVPTLAEELKKRNPGSHIIYDYDRQDNSFKRFFVSFKVFITGFLEGCRHLIGLDACHLKSKYLGMLLSAVALDGNNSLFTIAYAVVETESKETWKWFLDNLLESFGSHLHHLAFISDMEKGLGEATKLVFPYAEHRVCLRHLWKNMKKHFRFQDGHKAQKLFWAAANAYTEDVFENKVGELNDISGQACSYLMALPYLWSKSQFSAEIKSSISTNNMAESFNAWIVDARSKPAVDLVDTIRAMLMDQRAKRQIMSTTWHGELVPYAEQYIREITSRKDQFIIRHSGIFSAEVEDCHERHVVHLQNNECSCRFWQVCGLPCIHGVAFICSTQQPVWHNYVHASYYVSRYKIAYEGTISPMLGKEKWSFIHDSIQIGVPNSSRPRGRPRKRRFKNFLEDTSHGKRSKHKCSRCGLWGHHRNSCKNPLTQDCQTLPSCFESCSQTKREKLVIRRGNPTTAYESEGLSDHHSDDHLSGNPLSDSVEERYAFW